MCNLVHIQAQNLDGVVNTNTELLEVIFDHKKNSKKLIHTEKATYQKSVDAIGWVERIKGKRFGSPNFRRDMIDDIYRKIDSLRTPTDLNSNELYHSISQEIVDSFFLEEDPDYMIQQMKAAKKERWDNAKYELTFHDMITAQKISEPYYSKDQTRAVVFLISPTQESAEFYRKNDGSWEFYFGSLLWIE